MADEINADGFDISWTRTNLDRATDTELLATFLSEFKSKLAPEKQLIVTVTPHGTFNKRYHLANLNRFEKKLKIFVIRIF